MTPLRTHAWVYNTDLDQLAVYLHQKPDVAKRVETEDSNMCQGVDSEGLWRAVFFGNASTAVCRLPA